MRFHELSDRRPEAIEALMQETFSEPFDLVQGPLYRAKVLRLGADNHLLVLAIHHAIADGWTLGAFVRDLCEAYVLGRVGAPAGLPPVQLSYSAWGAAERAIWRPAKLISAFLSGDPTWREHSGCGPSRRFDIMSSPLRRSVSLVPANLGRAARELARRNGATLFSVLLTAFRVALSRWAGAMDVVVGTPVANRSQQAMRGTMGYCAGIVPLRGHVEHDRPLSDGLRVVHQASIDCFANAIPFVELTRALGDPPSPGHTPIFDVRFALQNHPLPYAAVPGLSVRLKMRSTGTSRFHLGCEITENGEALEVVWLFRPKLFPRRKFKNCALCLRLCWQGFAARPRAEQLP